MVVTWCMKTNTYTYIFAHTYTLTHTHKLTLNTHTHMHTVDNHVCCAPYASLSLAFVLQATWAPPGARGERERGGAGAGGDGDGVGPIFAKTPDDL